MLLGPPLCRLKQYYEGKIVSVQEVKVYTIDMEDEPFQEVYFIGIAMPPELDQQIADLKWRLFETNEAALKPLLPHVTLLNPPSLRGIMPSELIPKVREIATRYLPLTISLEDVGMFGDRVCFINA
jgi:hypothetical protein